MKTQKGYSLHIALNKLSHRHYKGWDGKLNSCKHDAIAMLDISIAQGFSNLSCLFDENATKSNFIENMEWLATNLVSGDFLFISFSGHGGQIIDRNNDEIDFKDEFWCFFDGILIDDIFYRLLLKFKEGVRILIISDSCHSGSIMKGAGSGSSDFPTKKSNQPTRSINASIQSISSCSDSQVSTETSSHGRFTKVLLESWASGKFKGDYQLLFEQIKSNMVYGQTPEHNFLGKDVSSFQTSHPFQI